MDVIFEFIYEHAFLSNFYPAEVVMDGRAYPSVEHAYQAAKTNDRQEREIIRNLPTPGSAKKAGRSLLKMRPDWNDTKEEVMFDLVRQKFSSDPLRAQLLGTGDAILIEGNSWGDRFWGVSGGQGLNKLGLILMAVREGLAVAAV